MKSHAKLALVPPPKDVAVGVATGDPDAGICMSCGEETDYENYCPGCDFWICDRCVGAIGKRPKGPHSPDDHPDSPYAIHVMRNGRIH